MKRSVLTQIGRFLSLLMLFGVFVPQISIAGIGKWSAIAVTGKVIDSKNQPLAGVSVMLKGTSIGAVTNSQGKYNISIPDPSGVLVFSFIGFIPQEIAVNNQHVINVKLNEENKSLDEIVVIGYGTQKKRDVTGAIGSVSSDQIKQVVANNPVAAVQGRVAGVNVSQDNWRPGGTSTIRVRGTRSITASNSPLYVVDGNPINRGDVTINDINPSDIESIEILKDASATAIYGSRGANGVVLITTRRGKAGKATVDINSYEGFQHALRTVDVWNGAEYADYVRDSYRYTTGGNKYNSPTPNMDEDKTNPQFALSPYVLESVLMGYDTNGNYDPAKVRSFDWLKAVMQTGRLESHQISINGGSEKTKANVSAGYFKNKGIIKNQNYQRVNVRINLDQQIADWLKIGTSTLVSKVNEDIGSNLYGIARGTSPLASPYAEDGSLLLHAGNDPLQANPLLDIDGIVSDSWKTRVLTNMYVEATITSGLKFRSNFGWDYRTARDGLFQKAMSTPRDGGSDYASYGGNVANDILSENMLFYDKTIANDHKINLTLLESTQTTRFETYTESAKNLPYQAQQFFNLGSANDILGIGSRLEKTQMLSFMARLNYDYKGKYLLTFTGRRDASSVLANGNKSKFFPSAALAWRVSQEKFLVGNKTIDDLKLRLSYGQVGNSSVAPYQTQGNLGLVRYVWDETTVIGYGPNLMPNPNLSWEISATADAAIDYSLFNGRVMGTIEGYRTNTNDLIMPRKLPITSGFPEVLSNVGSTRNTGLEFSITTDNVRSHSMNWKTSLTFSTNKEEITGLVKGKVDDVGNLWFIGEPPIGIFYDLKAIGIWQDTPGDLAEIAKFNANGQNFTPGTVRLADRNGDYKITADDRYILGSRTPKYTAGFSSDLNYKSFDLSFQLYASQGAMGYYDRGIALNGRPNQTDIDYWTPSNPSNKYPKANAGWLGPDYVGTLYYEDASYVRVKYITLGYAFSDAFKEKIKLKNLRIYVSAQNPFLFTKFTGLDPEGVQGINSPSVKTFMLGLNATF